MSYPTSSSTQSLYNNTNNDLNGFKSGATMWFNLDSNTTWSSSFQGKIQPAKTNIQPSAPSNSFYYTPAMNNNTNTDPRHNVWPTEINQLVKPKITLAAPISQPRSKIPADEFVHISSNQRWNNQTIEFSNFQQVQVPKQQQQTYVPVIVSEKKIQPIPANYLVAPSTLNIPSSPIVQPPIVVENNPQNTPIQPQPLVEEESSSQSLYKTELCRSYEETGTCRYGLKCQFAHGKSELRPVTRHPKYKTEVCKTFHTIGTCPYGKRCRFIHTEPPFIQQGTTTPPTTPTMTPNMNMIQEPKVVPVNNKSLILNEVNVNGINENWSEITTTPVNLFSPVVGKEITAAPVVAKTSNKDISINERRSRLGIFQQICA